MKFIHKSITLITHYFNFSHHFFPNIYLCIFTHSHKGKPHYYYNFLFHFFPLLFHSTSLFYLEIILIILNDTHLSLLLTAHNFT